MAKRKKLPKFLAADVRLMEAAPGNVDHADGEPIQIVTVGRTDGTIEAMALSLHDTKELAVRLLAGLAAHDDEFAHELLEDHFDSDAEGHFTWPRTPR